MKSVWCNLKMSYHNTIYPSRECLAVTVSAFVSVSLHINNCIHLIVKILYITTI
jgi:hypothetical protein